VSAEKPALPTRIGHAEWGDNRFRGHSVARDLAGQESIVGLLALSIGGRRLGPEERRLLDDLATVLTVGDPRVWPLKLVRVASAYGGCLAAVAAATVSFAGARVGHPAAGLAAEVLTTVGRRIAVATASGEASAERALEDECHRLLSDGARPYGFGVPFRSKDERLLMLTERVVACGRSDRAYWRLFERVAETMRRIRGLEANVGLGAAAVCLDIGFTPAQIGPLITALCSADFWSNAFEGAEQAPACMQILPADSIRYVGPVPIRSPRADCEGKGVQVSRTGDDESTGG
jgi:hypothetical protein